MIGNAIMHVQVTDMAANPNYLHRMSALYCLRDLCGAVSTEDACSRVVPVILNAAADSVPNIRFVSAKILQSLKSTMTQDLIVSQVLPCLQTLSRDADADVRYFAEVALADFGSAAS